MTLDRFNKVVFTIKGAENEFIYGIKNHEWSSKESIIFFNFQERTELLSINMCTVILNSRLAIIYKFFCPVKTF